MKHTNILITDDGPVLTDLDGMVAHRWKWFFGIQKSKDLARFSRS